MHVTKMLLKAEEKLTCITPDWSPVGQVVVPYNRVYAVFMPRKRHGTRARKKKVTKAKMVNTNTYS